MNEPLNRFDPDQDNDPFEPLFQDRSRGAVQVIPLDNIQDNPMQPRRNYDPEKISALSRSLIEHGQLQPIVVRPLDSGGYQVIAGHRRVRAAKEARWKSLQALVRPTRDDELAQLALVENIQRQDLDLLDEVDTTLQLISISLEVPINEVTALIHKVRRQKTDHRLYLPLQAFFGKLGQESFENFYSNKLPILKYPEDVKNLLRRGSIKIAHAKLLAQLKDESKRITLIQRLQDRTLKPIDLKKAIEESARLFAELIKNRRIPGQIKAEQTPDVSKPWQKKVSQFESQINKFVPSAQKDPEARKGVRDMLLKLLEQFKD